MTNTDLDLEKIIKELKFIDADKAERVEALLRSAHRYQNAEQLKEFVTDLRETLQKHNDRHFLLLESMLRRMKQMSEAPQKKKAKWYQNSAVWIVVALLVLSIVALIFVEKT
jgi:hypothetical protein